MADEYCRNLLESWGLKTNLISRFSDNGINEAVMKDLTPALIKELIPHIGLRVDFTKKWEATFLKTEPLKLNKPDDSNTDATTLTLASDSEVNSESCEEEPKSRKRKHSSLERSLFRTPPAIDVRQLLESTAQGRAIIKSYKNTNQLTRKSRNLLVEIIISHTLESFESGTKILDYEYLTEKIIEIFPTETPGTYYIPPIKKKFSRTKKSVTARGKLVDKYHNKIREYRSLTGLTKSYTSTSDAEASGSESTELQLEIEQSRLWLQHNREPWESVLIHWKKTASYRHAGGAFESKKVSDIYEQWPILKDPMGHILIDEDFKYLHQSNHAVAFIDWPNFFAKLQLVCPIKPDKHASHLLDFHKQELDSGMRNIALRPAGQLDGPDSDDFAERCRTARKTETISQMNSWG